MFCIESVGALGIRGQTLVVVRPTRRRVVYYLTRSGGRLSKDIRQEIERGYKVRKTQLEKSPRMPHSGQGGMIVFSFSGLKA